VLALGRIIYFSNSGREEAGSAQPLPDTQAVRSAAQGSRAPGARGERAAWVPGLAAARGQQGRDAGSVAQVAAGRGEAAAQRYQAGLAGGALGLWMEAEARGAEERIRSLPCYPALPGLPS
jgi:hypothetical protein